MRAKIEAAGAHLLYLPPSSHDIEQLLDAFTPTECRNYSPPQLTTQRNWIPL
jgi:hypothetical protein